MYLNYQPKSNLLDNKIIMVTGASEGIGREAAITYANHGASLILLGRNAIKLKAVKQAIEMSCGKIGSTIILVFDLASTDPKQYQQLSHQLLKQIPRINGLLNNAGIIGEIVPIAQQTPARWLEVINVNVNGTFMLTQTILPLLLKATNPSLIFSSSSVGRSGRANWGAYSVSKFATEGMMQVLSKEYRASILRINSINPGATQTRMRAIAYPKEDIKKLKKPADIMSIYLYLMGDDSLHKTGISFDAQPNEHL